MSLIADSIRECVADPYVSDHYGPWGDLCPERRRMIRKLCDTCDIFEKDADAANAEANRVENYHIVEGNKLLAEIARLKIEKQSMETEISTMRESVILYKVEVDRLQKYNTEMARKHYDDGIKEFTERLCEGRVSNDPVVIAAKCLLKEMTEGTNGES